MIFINLYLVLLTGVAAYMDLRWTRVKNCWLIFGLIGGILLNIFYPKSCGLLSGFIGMIIPFLLLVAIFAINAMGAGDIKLFCVAGMVLGMERILMFILLSFSFVVIYWVVGAIRCRSFKKALFRKIKVAPLTAVASLVFLGGSIL